MQKLNIISFYRYFVQLETCNDDSIAETVFDIVNSQSGSKHGTMTVAEVDNALNLMTEDQAKQFQILYQKSSATDLKWLIKIMLKNMKLSISDKKILDNYHPLANALFERYNHLSKVCEFVETGVAERALKEVKPFLPIRAMLSQKVTSDTNKNFLEKYVFFAETKLDGERFQIHMEQNVFKYYSRNAHDYSAGLSDMMTHHIKFKSVVHSIVLDGEMLVWSKKDKRFLTKGESDVDVKRLDLNNHSYRPCFCPFDILYLNGVSYMERPYSDRTKILENLITDEEGVIMRVVSTKVRDSEHIATLLNIAMHNDEEGIILKNGASKYQPGERNAGWFKVKPDYLDDNVVKDFDVIIIGGKYQNEHSKDFIQKYILGVVDKKNDGTFDVYAIGEAFSGLSVQKRLELSQTLCTFGTKYSDENEVLFEKGKVIFGKNKPHIFLPPHKSRILEIRASELAPSSEFYTPYTFRFPRIQNIRTDKFWDEVCTFNEFEELYKDADGKVVKINQRKVHKDDVSSPPKKKLRSRNPFKDAMYKFCQDPQGEVTPIDKVLDGLDFCVLGTAQSLPSMHDLQILLRLHGASLTAFPRKNKTFAIIAGDLQNRNVKKYTTNANAEDNHSVINAEWIEKHFESDEVLNVSPKLVPRDFLFMSEKVKKRFAGSLDKYGDSYRQQIGNIEELKHILSTMDKSNFSRPSVDQMLLFDAQLYDEKLPNPNLFRGIDAIFIHPDDSKTQVSIAENIFKFRAGKIVKEEDEEDDDEKAIIFVEKLRFKKDERADLKHRKIINVEWIWESSKAGKKLDFNDYEI